jgi:hypothetical protein
MPRPYGIPARAARDFAQTGPRPRHPGSMILRTPLLLLLTAALGATTARADKTPAPAPPAAAKADAAFPVPKDAVGPENAPGADGKIVVYQVPRGRDVVIAEVVKALEAGGWTIGKNAGSPSGRAVRLEVAKGETRYKASFTGDATRTSLILTLP